MNITLSSKAKTLEDLSKLIKSAYVLPLVRFSIGEYKENKEDVLKKCLAYFETEVIVRSSSLNEDNDITSNAGGFDSVLHVKQKKDSLNEAILKVINSYGESAIKDDEVFVQPMLQKVSMCGVVLTADIDTLAPYYTINYDDSGSTSSVTSGESNELQTIIIAKESVCEYNEKISKLLLTCKECESIFEKENLDIEFAFEKDKLYILQVREIVKNKKKDLSTISLKTSLDKLHSKIKKLNAPHPKLLGSKAIYGVMPDWNPAEIIGIKPKALALSLYKELVTDAIWAYQRDNYGYRNLRSFPLLVSFLGVPFIDVRVSFNSFVPKKLHDSIALKLVEYYLDELKKNANHHDKIEFEIVFSCYFFGIDKKLKKLQDKNFSSSEIKRIEFELLELTNNIIDIDNGLYKKDLEKIEFLQDKYKNIVESDLSIVDKIYWLIEDCKRYGTLPFAGVARAAFIAVQFLNSFVSENIMTKEELALFLNSLQTVSKQLSQDIHCMTKEEFLQVYGHLRPGTYDINSKRYDEAYGEYFIQKPCKTNHQSFEFTAPQIEKIEKLIVENGIQSNSTKLLRFIKESIEGREYAKFAFTKHLSKVLQLIEDFGLKIDISREDIAHLDIQAIRNLYASLDERDVQDIFNSNIEKNKALYEYTKAIKLPSLICNEMDIFQFTLEKNEPNFVTLKQVNAKVVNFDFKKRQTIQGCIVCVESADPGYDFLFSGDISGLITCYGGANSHMAIRCAELGIPAVIGCGQRDFDVYKKASVLYIDSLNKQVKVVS